MGDKREPDEGDNPASSVEREAAQRRRREILEVLLRVLRGA
jgi:hypothetical protein